VGVAVNSKCWELENIENGFTQCCLVNRTDSTVGEYHIDEKCLFVFVGDEAIPLLKTVKR
jgi:hypothetical protein